MNANSSRTKQKEPQVQTQPKRKLKLYRMELDYKRVKITTCCFAYDLEQAEGYFLFKDGDTNPEVKIKEKEITPGPFLSITHHIENNRGPEIYTTGGDGYTVLKSLTQLYEKVKKLKKILVKKKTIKSER